MIIMSQFVSQKIKSLATLVAPDVIEMRHHLHAHPELSFQEFETSKFIQQQLSLIGIPFEVLATTGVVGIIQGKNPQKRVVALRADMDALPIQEENEVSYKSTNPGIMHACGHDVHTSCLIGAAKILHALRDEWEGTVKLVFQPGEEKNPGGASLMIKAGVLENPKPERIYALHVHNILQVGKLSFRGGKVMASADEIYITIKAKGGHAASPQHSADTILIASTLIVQLQQIISRQNDPFNPSVLSFTAFNGGNTTNVIPSEVKLMGTFRAMDEVWRFKAHDLIKNQARSIVEGMGANIDIKIDVGYPFVLNNEKLSSTAMQQAIDFLGQDNVEETELRMGAEDFAYYSHEIPGCFFRLGVGNIQKGISIGVHTSTFNIDENAIETGISAMALFGAIG
jgi:hippurate hydrolase